jgi:very-short-patch-repair endonuclease
MTQLHKLFEGGVGRDWRKVLKGAGINITTRQGLWDAMHPTQLFCPKCSKERPVKQTNIGRLETCGDAVCRLSVKREKTEATSLERYGVVRPQQSPEIKKRYKKQCLEKFGVQHPTQLKETQRKRLETNLARYGHACPAQSADNRKIALQRKKTADEKRFQERLLPKFNNLAVERYQTQVLSASTTNPRRYVFQHVCGKIWETTCSDRIPRCPVCGSSKEERFIEEALYELGIQSIQRTRKIISPYELDFLLPSRKLAIEVNGSYWHQDGKSTPLLLKTQLAHAAGIRLIHIMDWECNEKPSIVKSHLCHAFGKTEVKIQARKCKVAQVTSSQARIFLEKTHLAGFQPAKMHLGLYFEDTIVAVLSVGKPRWGNEDAEIIRWATALFTAVQGGFSKCLAVALKSLNPKSVVSFCDRRWGTGEVYSKSGFILERNTPPGYVWCKGTKRLTRYQTQKHNLQKILGDKFDKALSEKDNLESAGWWKISDCGHQRWFLINRER